MKDFEQQIGQVPEILPQIAGGDGTSDAFVSKAAIRRLARLDAEARRAQISLDVVASGHGESRTVRAPRGGR